MTATVTRGSPASGNTGAGSAAAGSGVPGRRAARRRGPGFPRASTTPGKVRLVQAVFAGCAAAGSGAFTGLVAGVAVLALAMAAGCAWGLSRRLAEYR